MSTKKTLATQIEEALADIRQRENRLKELLNKQKAKERSDRTHRLCERCGYLESVLPETIPLTFEQFKALLDKTMLTDNARRILAGFASQRGSANAEAGQADSPLASTVASSSQSAESRRQAG